MGKITIYTDGSCIGNGSVDSKCGWAVKLMYNGNYKTKTGYETGKTNNYMEMLAVLNGLKSITDKTIPCQLISDSQYVVKTINKEFRVGMNEKLWKEIFAEVEKFSDLEVRWVRGHDKDRHNNDVDKLAYETALKGGAG